MTRLKRGWCQTLCYLLLGVLLILNLLPLAAQTISGDASKAPVDLILIIDTSATMAGKAGGQNIFPAVKKTLKELIDASGPGDNVVLVPYDTDVRARATALIYGIQDKVALREEIEGLNATGLWTYTAAAIQKGLEEASRLDEAQGTAKHAKVIVLLTDGINEPPPAVRGTTDEIHLSEVTHRFQGMPWFVWQVQLGPKVDIGVDEAFHAAGFPNYRPVRTAAADLNDVRTDILKAAEAETARQAAERAAAEKRALAAQSNEDTLKRIEQAHEQAESAKRREADAKERETRRLQEEAARRAERRKMLIAAALLAGLAVAGTIIVLLRRRPRPHGSLQYWKHGAPLGTFDIAAAGKRRLRLGPANGDLVLTGLGERGVTLSAMRVEGQVLCVVEADDGAVLTFRGKQVGRLELYDRDEFQLGDHSLQYEGEVDSRTD